jgi:hypothetical protein
MQGDSIIFGFHTPLDAVWAAVQAQEALLQANWAPELLEHPLCRPQHVVVHAARSGVKVPRDMSCASQT